MRDLLICSLLLAGLGFGQPATAQILIKLSDVQGPCISRADRSSNETPPETCQAAIATASDNLEKAKLHFSWAWSLNDFGNNIAALPNLDKAVALAPDFVNAWHERAYTRNALGYYADALSDSNRAISLKPDNGELFVERAFANFRLGKFAEQLADRERAIALLGPSPTRSIARADALVWLGRYAEAELVMETVPAAEAAKAGAGVLEAITLMRDYKPRGDPAKRCTLGGISDEASAWARLADCVWAFDHEADPVKRADFLTVKAAALVVAKQSDRVGAIETGIAAELDPGNPQRHFNLGSRLLASRHSWAARNSFNRALAITGISSREKALALAGRAQAQYNLNENAAALGDAKAAFEIDPNPFALAVLGQLAADRGDSASAKLFWLGQWRMGVRDDGLRANLASLGVDDPDKEPRK